jgi:hypothetical protein
VRARLVGERANRGGGDQQNHGGQSKGERLRQSAMPGLTVDERNEATRRPNKKTLVVSVRRDHARIWKKSVTNRTGAAGDLPGFTKGVVQLTA